MSSHEISKRDSFYNNINLTCQLKRNDSLVNSIKKKRIKNEAKLQQNFTFRLLQYKENALRFTKYRQMLLARNMCGNFCFEILTKLDPYQQVFVRSHNSKSTLVEFQIISDFHLLFSYLYLRAFFIGNLSITLDAIF